MNLGMLKLAKYANLKSTDLTTTILQDVADALGMKAELSDEVTAGIQHLLKTESIDTLADLLASPTVFPRIQAAIMANANAYDDNLIICPHCSNYINPQAVSA